MAVLRNGLFDPQSQQQLMTAVLQEQSQSGDDHPDEHDRQKRRRKALEARKKLKDARKLANKGLPESELSSPQIALLLELNSGVLEKICLRIIKLTDMAKA